MKNCIWVKAELVVQIEFGEWTPDGHLRHSRFVALRDDSSSPRPDGTPNIDETGDGFRCDAFFPDKVLSLHALSVGQKMTSGAMSGTIRVKLEVKTEDVVGIIVRTESGPESTLYVVS